MPYLSADVVGRAARRLFGTGHSESLVFFFLKAEGASTDKWTDISSSNEPPEGLKKIALQPEGFDKLVTKYLDAFSDRNEEGWPTRPGARGSPEDYAMYFPITEEPQYILRKRDCNRNAVWSNITGGRNALNSDKAKAEDVFETREGSSGHGKEVRFREGYEFAAFWYYGPKKGRPLYVPLKALAVWMHRPPTKLPENATIEGMVEDTVAMLNITKPERHLLFDERDDFPFGSDDLVKTFELEPYFNALCIPHATVHLAHTAVDDRLLSLDREKWVFLMDVLQLKASADSDPVALAEKVIGSGQRNVLFYGPPRTGKSTAAVKVAARYLGISDDDVYADKRFTQIQFHQSWTYGDFIRKLVPIASGAGIALKRQKGVFLNHCEANSTGKSVVLIDEINRANLSSVFGEAFHVIEVGYRGRPIALPGSTEEEENSRNATLTVPPGLLLLATANDLDRSTQALDFALLGRFGTVPVPPRYGVVYGTLASTKGWTPERAETFVTLLNQVEAISAYPIGHAYFYGFGDPASVQIWYQTVLRPTIALYLTRFRTQDLDRIDQLFAEWLS